MEKIANALMIHDLMAAAHARSDAVVAALQGTIESQGRAIHQLQEALAAEREQRAVSLMGAAGLLGQAKALKDELARVAPDSPLLADTGRAYPSGKRRLALNVIYEDAFDAKAGELGLGKPGSAFRPVAR